MEKKEKLSKKYGFTPLVFKGKNGTIPFCQALIHPELDGKPVVFLFLHGAGERGTDNDVQLVHVASPVKNYLEQRGIKALMLFPQCPADVMWIEQSWAERTHEMTKKPTPRLALAHELLLSKIKEFHGDRNRIYVAGISMGGFGTWDMISRYPKLFAAAMPVCGGGDVKQAKRLIHLPLMVYHGSVDGAVMVERSRDMVTAIRAAGGNVTYHEIFNFNHDVWSFAFADFHTLDWLFAQRKNSNE